jgi:hypothetical protein
VTIYRIRALGERFQKIVLADPEAFHARYPGAFSGSSLNEQASNAPIPCHVDDPSKPAADFSAFLPGSFVFSDEAAARARTNMLSQVVWGDCELLNLDVGGKLHYAVNARICNCFDRQAASYETLSGGPAARIQRYAFHKDRMSWNVFKIPETAAHEIFTYTGSPEGLAEDSQSPRFDDEFVLGYREDGYTGLDFEVVWTSEGNEHE